MNESQALAILDQIAAKVSLNREDTLKVLQAVKVLEDAIKPKETPKPKEGK